ncbi:MAG: hypothetical protein IPK85_26860 [Gemmatimonadetes bacterium]|nr:hypothetical protein [Gemmatimonadota bacterium]
MNDVTRRFLNGVLERVPESRIVEVRVFPAMRQGGVESGIAVLAVEQGFDSIPDATAALEMDELVEDAVDGAVVPADHEMVMTLAIAEVDDAESDDLGDAGSGLGDSWPVTVTSDEAAVERERALLVTSDGVHVADLPLHEMADATVGDVERELDTDVALADVGVAEPEESIALGDILALPAPERTVPVRDPQERLAILCARYRLVLKGPDRGKWELEVVHQADAPLATLDRVIAGVVRRSGETAEPERLSGESLRTRLDAPPWVEGAAA